MNNPEKEFEAFTKSTKRTVHGYLNMNSEYHQMHNDFAENQRYANSGQTIISPPSQKAQRTFSDKPQERYVWEMRTRSPNLTPASTVLNSPDMNTDVQYCMPQQQRQHMQIHVGRSPGQFEPNNLLPQVISNLL